MLLVFLKAPWWWCWLRQKHVADYQCVQKTSFTNVHSLVSYLFIAVFTALWYWCLTSATWMQFTPFHSILYKISFIIIILHQCLDLPGDRVLSIFFTIIFRKFHKLFTRSFIYFPLLFRFFIHLPIYFFFTFSFIYLFFFTFSFIYLFIHSFIYLFFLYFFIYLFILIYFSLPFRLFIYLFIHSFIYFFFIFLFFIYFPLLFRFFIHLSIYSFMYLFFLFFVYLFIFIYLLVFTFR